MFFSASPLMKNTFSSWRPIHINQLQVDETKSSCNALHSLFRILPHYLPVILWIWAEHLKLSNHALDRTGKWKCSHRLATPPISSENFWKKMQLICGFLQYTAPFLDYIHRKNLFTRHFYWYSNYFISLPAPTMTWFLPWCLVYGIPNSKGIFFSWYHFFLRINFLGIF